MKPYCSSLIHYARFKTREVMVGDLGIGGTNPIRIQSMTTTDTMDTEATVAQSIRMIEAGCELVRITAPTLNDAKNLEAIRDTLRRRGYHTPLVADIHFTPNAAEWAARIVEKVRVNPGNYADKKKFETHDYSDRGYAEELERIRLRFLPLVKICKEYGTALRIGTNHGSLSDRILSRYGDTPLGMVESALEFVRICEDEGFYEIVLSMKASNPQVMVQAYRMLVSRMIQDGIHYPLHLGVTEAGDGEDGRIKSSAGIGTLLEDGLGDTIRVSLTEEPEFEIPVARYLVNRCGNISVLPSLQVETTDDLPYNPFEYRRRITQAVQNIGGSHFPVVIADYSRRPELHPSHLFASGYRYSVSNDKWTMGDMACDYIYTGSSSPGFAIPGSLGIITDYIHWQRIRERERHYPLLLLLEYAALTEEIPCLHFVQVDMPEVQKNGFPKILSRAGDRTVIVLSTSEEHPLRNVRAFIMELMRRNMQHPVILRFQYAEKLKEPFTLFASTDAGGLLLDGMGDGVWLEGPMDISENILNSVSFGILQATRTRISKTEYISCPSCGRTQFDLQETTARIRARTHHLKGVKIGIMGCIVNGPGEMADADYGYVGTGTGKITLYKGHEIVQRNINERDAVDALVDLIRRNGQWIEQEVLQNS